MTVKTPRKEDRRVRRTKKMLLKSLAELMNEMEFKDITVKEITDRADMNRGTFYLHYTDTYDLLEKVEDELIADFETLIDNYTPSPQTVSGFPIINQVFDYLQENIEICRTLLCSSPAFVEKIVSVITRRGLAIGKLLGKPENNENLTICLHQFIAHGILGALSVWLENNMTSPTKEEMAKFLDETLGKLL